MGSTEPEVEKHLRHFQYPSPGQIRMLALQQGWEWALALRYQRLAAVPQRKLLCLG